MKNLTDIGFEPLDAESMIGLPLRRKFMERSIINTTLSLLMKGLVIGQRQKKLLISRLFIGHRTIVWFPLVSIS